MAQLFLRKTSQGIGTAPVAIGAYTVPGGSVAVVMGLILANVLATDITVSVTLHDGTTSTYLIKDVAILAGRTLPWDVKINLQAGDSLQVSASAANALDVVLSILERT